jgi:hypothetical protein
MKTNTTTIYPNTIARLGGAIKVVHDGQWAWVTFPTREINLPYSLIKAHMDDGVKVAIIAQDYALKKE